MRSRPTPSSVLAFALLPLTACFSSSSSSSDAGFELPDTGGFTTDGGADARAEAQATDAAMTDAPAADGATDAPTEAGPSSAAGIYVTNQTGTVTVFAPDATGNAAPLRTIGGAMTQLSLPIGVAVDAQGEVIVANRQGGTVTVYPAMAGGNVAPTRTLTATGMGSPQGVTLGQGGDVNVSTCPNCGSANGGSTGIFHFPGGSSQSDTSVAGTSTGLTDPLAIQLDAQQNLWVANAFGGPAELFAAAASGNVAPTQSFTPAGDVNVQSMAYGAGAVFLSVPSSGVEVFAATSTGAASPAATLAGEMLPLQYPAGIFVDVTTASPTVYLLDNTASALYVIHTTGTAPNLSIASVSTIAGATTTLDGPLGVYVAR